MQLYYSPDGKVNTDFGMNLTIVWLWLQRERELNYLTV